MKKDPKAVVIGLDAATWTLIQPWMAEGSMPNLARLMQSGCQGSTPVCSASDHAAGLDFFHDR